MRVQNAAVRPFDVSRLEDEVRDVVLQKQPPVQVSREVALAAAVTRRHDDPSELVDDEGAAAAPAGKAFRARH